MMQIEHASATTAEEINLGEAFKLDGHLFMRASKPGFYPGLQGSFPDDILAVELNSGFQHMIAKARIVERVLARLSVGPWPNWPPTEWKLFPDRSER